jgi:hypothetical protein
MDSGVEQPFTFNEAISLLINCDTQDEIDYYWDKLSAVPEAQRDTASLHPGKRGMVNHKTCLLGLCQRQRAQQTEHQQTAGNTIERVP